MNYMENQYKKHLFNSQWKMAFFFGIILFFAFSCSTDNTSFDTDISVPVSVTEVKTSSIEQYVNTTGSVYAMEEELNEKGKLLKKVRRLRKYPFVGKVPT